MDVDDYEQNGYVSKQFVSDSEVAPKTEEERSQAADAEAIANAAAADPGTTGETAPADPGTTGETAPADPGTTGETAPVAADPAATTDVDAQYGVEPFAEAYALQATAGANLRQVPSQDGDIIAVVASGTSVTALGSTDRWYKVDYNGTVGYVNRNLFTA